METNEKLKLRRKELGLTLEDVAKTVGVGKSTVRKWETGDIANMKRDKIALLAKALKVSPAFIMGWDESMATVYSFDLSHKNKESSPLVEQALQKIKGLSKENQQRAIDYVDYLMSKDKDQEKK